MLINKIWLVHQQLDGLVHNKLFMSFNDTWWLMLNVGNDQLYKGLDTPSAKHGRVLQENAGVLEFPGTHSSQYSEQR